MMSSVKCEHPRLRISRNFSMACICSCENCDVVNDRNTKRENKAISRLASSCPDTIMPQFTLDVSRFLPVSRLMRLLPTLSHNPFRNSYFSISREFLNSSKWTSALETCPTVSAIVGRVEVDRLGALLYDIKKAMREWPSSVLPDPFGPNRFSMGKPST